MTLSKIIRNSLLVLSLGFSNILFAQSVQTQTVETQQQIYGLLQMDCGTNGQLKAFTERIKSLSDNQPKIFVRTLREGLPERLRANIRKQASMKFDRRQAWVKGHASDLFDEQTVSRLAQETLEDYVADSVRNANFRFRENSVRALGIVGDRKVVDLIKSAADREPDLAVIAKQAVDAIQARIE